MKVLQPTALSIACFFISALQVQSTEEHITVKVTGYGAPDNDPPNSEDIAKTDVLHKKAGGVGTFKDPITVATKKGAYPYGTKFYVPYLYRYFILEDDCASCTKNSHLDVWVGGKGKKKDDVIACEECITRDSIEVIRNPKEDHKVREGPIFGDKGCFLGTYVSHGH